MPGQIVAAYYASKNAKVFIWTALMCKYENDARRKFEAINPIHHAARKFHHHNHNHNRNHNFNNRKTATENRTKATNLSLSS